MFVKFMIIFNDAQQINKHTTILYDQIQAYPIDFFILVFYKEANKIRKKKPNSPLHISIHSPKIGRNEGS